MSNLCLIYIQKHLCNSKQIKQQLSKFFNIIKHPNSIITIPFYKLPLESPSWFFLEKKHGTTKKPPAKNSPQPGKLIHQASGKAAFNPFVSVRRLDPCGPIHPPPTALSSRLVAGLRGCQIWGGFGDPNGDFMVIYCWWLNQPI